MQGLTTVVVAIVLLTMSAFPDGQLGATGTIQGVVFNLDSKGNRAVIPAAKISLDGSKHM